METTIFITEGDSASGSITKSRDVATQAVFSLKGKPLNTYGLTKKIVYENEEFNLLQAALNIEDGLDGLRYKNGSPCLKTVTPGSAYKAKWESTKGKTAISKRSTRRLNVK